MKKNLLYLCLIFLFSCKKENGGDGDSQLPIILLSTPTNAQQFDAGESIRITSTITDNQRIKEAHLEITNTRTGAFLTHEHFAPDGQSFQIDKSFTAQAASSYKIKVEAEDLHGNKAKAEVNITTN